MNTANALGYVIGAISCYVLLRKTRPSQLYTTGLVITAVALLITGLSSQFLWLTALRLMSGVGAAWVFACGGALVAARFQDYAGLRGAATGIYFGGAGFGIVVSGILVNPLIAELGSHAWPTAWLMLGILAAIASVWPWIEAKRSAGDANRRTLGALNMQGLLPSLVSYLLFACGYIVYMTFIFAWLRSHNMSWQLVTLIWVVLGLGVSASPFVWRHALDGWNPSVTLAVSCAITFVGALVPTITVALPALLFSAALFGLGVFIAPSAVAVLVRRTMSPNHWAKAMTLFTVVFAIGQAVGPIVAGWIADRSTLDASLVFGATLLGAASLVAVVRKDRVQARIA